MNLKKEKRKSHDIRTNTQTSTGYAINPGRH